MGPSHKRAQIRQFFFSDVGNLHFLLISDTAPTLLHISVLLFFAGLLILLRNINHTVFNVVVVWVVICVAVYAYFTFLPIFSAADLHYSPLSSLSWQLYAYILYPVFNLLSFKKGIHNMDALRPARLLMRLEKKAEEVILGQLPELDARILETLLDTVDEGGTRETFFEAIPGFYNSQLVQVQDIKRHLSSMFVTKFRRSLDHFLEQTLFSDSISELGRSRRLVTCLKSTNIVLGNRAGMSITDRIIRCRTWIEVPPSPEIGHILKRWRNSSNSRISVVGRCIIARITACVGKHDDTWMALTKSHLGVT